jgi:hypothetical protein
MNIELKTSLLQGSASKSTMCVTNNKLLPITSLISFKVKDNTLILTTSDGTNFLYVRYPEKVPCEDVEEFAVGADTFVRLVQKTTAEKISLSIGEEGNYLVVKGNGTYKLELPLDENGNPIKFGRHDISDNGFGSVVKKSYVAKILNFNKSSLATDLSMPVLTNYYCGDSVVTSDTFKISDTEVNLFDTPMLISPQVMDILNVMSSEDITYYNKDNNTVFETATEVLVAPITAGVESFPIDAIKQLVNSEFGSDCKLPKVAILDVLDRISLFVTAYDKKVVNLTFTKDGLMISSRKSNGVEVIPFVESNNFKDYTCCIDFEMFKAQIQTQTEDIIHLYYGSDIAIKLVDSNATNIVALVNEEE